MEKTNPFFKKRPSILGDKEAPIIARLPQHFFSSFDGLKKELLRHEACIALIPSTDRDFPFEYHAAFAYKDGTNRVYTMVLTQHDGQLKADPIDAIEKIVKETQPQQTPKKKNKKKSKKKRRK